MKSLLKRSLAGLLLLSPLGTGQADAQLIPMGPESVVVSGNALGLECPQVIGHANRSFTVVWPQNPSPALVSIAGQRFDSTGSPVGGPIDVDGGLSGRQVYALATENRGALGDIAVWSSYLPSSPETTWRFNARVLPGGDMFKVNAPSYVRQLFPRRVGGYVAAWPVTRGGGACSFALLDAAGHLAGPITRLSNVLPSAQCIQSAQALDGSFTVDWITMDAPSKVVLQRFGANGKPLGPAVVAIPSGPSAVRLASAPDGRSALTWVEYGAAEGGLTGTIRLRFFGVNGAPASIPIAVDSPPEPPAEAFNPEALAMDSSGRALLLWQLLDADSGGERYTLQLWTPGGPESSIRPLGANPVQTGIPFCASIAKAGQTWVVVWRAQRDNGDTAIFVRRFFTFG